MKSKEREVFEKYMQQFVFEGPDIAKSFDFANGEYVDVAMQTLWRCWMGALACQEYEAPRLVNRNELDGLVTICNEAIDAMEYHGDADVVRGKLAIALYHIEHNLGMVPA